MKNNIIMLDETTAIIKVKSKQYGDQDCLIDIEDIPKLETYSWTVKPCGHDLYYAHTTRGASTLSMHRLIMGYPANIIDHVNGNCLDNRKINLREVSYSENRRNSAKQTNTKCRYRGVYERKDYKGKYRAQIRYDGKIINIGTFKCPIEAARAYDKYALEAYGKFATTNFPT